MGISMALTNHRLYWALCNALGGGGEEKKMKGKCNYQNNNIISQVKLLFLIDSLTKGFLHKNQYTGRKWVKWPYLFWKQHSLVLQFLTWMIWFNSFIKSSVNCLFLQNGASVQICGVGILQMRTTADNSWKNTEVIWKFPIYIT